MPSKTRKQKKGGASLLGRSIMAAASLGMLPTAHGNHSHEPHEHHPLHFHDEHEHGAFNLASYRAPELNPKIVYIQTIPVASTSGKAKTSRRAKSKKSATRRSKSKRKAKTV